MGTYAICNVAASFLTAARHGWKLFPILPLVFACYHFAYGYGFLRGVLDFVILRPEAVGSFHSVDPFSSEVLRERNR